VAVSFLSNDNDVVLAVYEDGFVKEVAVGAPINDNGRTGSERVFRSNFRRSLNIRRKLSSIQGKIKYPSLSKDGSVMVATVDDSVYLFTVTDVLSTTTLKKLQSRFIRASAAPNGKSVLAVLYPSPDAFDSISNEERRRETKVLVWPEQSTFSPSRPTEFQADRALWGRNGEYFMVWKSFSGNPELLVYRTEDLLKEGFEPSAHCIWNKTFAKGHSRLDAQMLDRSQTEGGRVKIMVYGNPTSSTGKVAIWDIEADELVNEIGFNFEREILAEDRSIGGTDRTITPVTPTTTKDIESTMADDWNPTLCVSRNERWIAKLDWNLRCCVVCSLKSGAPIWKFKLPDFWAGDGGTSPPSITFDPQDRYLLLSSDKGHLAFAPLFLNLDSQIEKSRKENFPEGWWTTSHLHDHEALFKDLESLPSRAMSQAIPLRLTRKRNWFASETPDGSGEVKSIRDCVYLKHSKSFVCIAESVNDEVGIFLFKPFSKLYKRHRLRLAEDVEGSPRRIFAKDQGDGNDSIVICAGDSKVIALRGHICEGGADNEAFGLYVERQENIGSCHSVSQSADKTKLLFVCDSSVRVVDLSDLSMSEVEYKASLSTAFGIVYESMIWKSQSRSRWWQNRTRRVSDDGRTILLGWDVKKGRSLVVGPETEEGSVEDIVKPAEERISDFCSLSSDGSVAVCIDVDQLLGGQISVSMFDHISKTLAFSPLAEHRSS